MGKEIRGPRDIRPEDFPRAGSPWEKIIFLLRYGILAPSTHNSQPWRFRIEGQTLFIHNDPDIRIKEADIQGRDLHISFGCLIENIAIAGRALGFAPRVTYHRENPEDLVAEMEFGEAEPDPAESVLLAEIPKRVNVRGLFKPRRIPPEAASDLARENKTGLRLDMVDDPGKIQALAEITRQGLKLAYRSRDFRREMSRWMISSFSSRKEGIPGYSLRMPALVSLIFPWLVRTFDLGGRVGYLNYLSMMSVPLIGVWSADKDEPFTWLDIGRAGERVMLRARALGLKTSIFVASVEIGDLHQEVRRILECPGRPQFVVCIGYMDTEQKPSPRHSVEAKMIQ